MSPHIWPSHRGSLENSEPFFTKTDLCTVCPHQPHNNSHFLHTKELYYWCCRTTVSKEIGAILCYTGSIIMSKNDEEVCRICYGDSINIVTTHWFMGLRPVSPNVSGVSSCISTHSRVGDQMEERHILRGLWYRSIHYLLPWWYAEVIN